MIYFFSHFLQHDVEIVSVTMFDSTSKKSFVLFSHSNRLNTMETCQLQSTSLWDHRTSVEQLVLTDLPTDALMSEFTPKPKHLSILYLFSKMPISRQYRESQYQFRFLLMIWRLLDLIKMISSSTMRPSREVSTITLYTRMAFKEISPQLYIAWPQCSHIAKRRSGFPWAQDL